MSVMNMLKSRIWTNVLLEDNSSYTYIITIEKTSHDLGYKFLLKCFREKKKLKGHGND